MIAGSQGHRPFRPHESRLNECELQKPLFQHMQEKHAIGVFEEGGGGPENRIKTRQYQRRRK